MIGKAFQIHGDFKREHVRLSALVFASHQYSNELKRTLKELEDRELAVQSAQASYRDQHEKNKAMKAQVERQTAALLAPFATGPTVISSVTTPLNQQPANLEEAAKQEKDQAALRELLGK